jgi:hypothetical protein
VRMLGKRIGKAEGAHARQHVAADLVEAPEREAEILATQDLDDGGERDSHQGPAGHDGARPRRRAEPLQHCLHPKALPHRWLPSLWAG